MAVTRIQNNQITDGTVVAYAKLQAGSLTGNLFAPSVTLNSNVTINGNLFLSNAGNITTINATNTYINDPLVMFNNGYTGSLTGYDIGILVNRNLASLGSYGSVNTFLGWVEADSAFETLATTDTGTGITSINNAGYANFKTGNATMVSGTVTGTLGVTGATTFTTATGGGLQVLAIGNATPGTAVFTTATTGGLQAVAIGNATPGTGVFTTGTFNTATTGGLQAVAIGNVTPGTGAFTTASTTGNLTVGGNIAVTGNIVPSANVTYSLGTLNSRFKDIFLSGSTIYAGGFNISEETSGNLNLTANNGNRLQILGTAANVVQATGNVVAPYHLGSLVGASATITTSANITGTGASTNSTSGALVVMGGAGVAGQIYAGGIQNTPIGGTTASTATFTTATTGGLQAVAIGNVTPGSGAFTTGTFNTATTGGLQATAIGNVTAGLGYFTTATATTVNAATIGNTGATFSGATATLTGNVSVGNLTTAGSNGNISGVNTVFATLFSGSGASLTNLQASAVQGTVATANVANYIATTAVSANQTYYVTFADKTAGNVLVDDNSSLTFNPSTGTLSATYFTGTLLGTVSAANVAYYENITPLSNNQTYYLPFANVTTGNSTLGATTSVNVNPSTGAVYSTSANTTTLNAGGTADIAGVTKITNATQSTGASSGALQVTGGASVGGNLYVGGWSTLNGNVTIGGNLSVIGQSVSIGASTLSISDPIINLNTPQDLTPLTVPTTTDIGVKFHYYDTSDSAAFLGRAVDTGYLEWYSRGTDTANVFVGTVYGTSKSGALILANAKTVGGGLTANTGTLQVWGDGAINGNLFVGGTFTTPSINGTAIGNVTASTGVFTTLNATGVTASTVSAVTIGNIGAKITGDGGFLSNIIAANIGGTVTTANVSLYQQLTNSTTNATFYLPFYDKATGNSTPFTNTSLNFRPSDGYLFATAASIATVTATTVTTSSTLLAQGNIVASSSTPSTSTTTGALIAVGGVGIAGNLNVGGATTMTTATATTINAATVGNIGANVVGTGTYLTSLTGSNVNGTVATANVSLYDNITTYTTNQTFYLQFANVANGNTNSGAVTTVNVNPSTGNVYATAFVGSGVYLSGVAGAGTGNVSFYSNISNFTNNQTYYLTYSNVTTGNSQIGAVSTVSVNPSTGTVSASGFSGGTGSFTTATTGGLQAVAIGNATPGSGAFTTGTFSSTLGVTGATTMTTATTGGLQAVAIGNATPGTGAFTTLTSSGTTIASGNIVAASGTASTSATTGALVVAGTGGLAVGGNTFLAGSTILNSSQTAGFDTIIRGKNDATLLWARPNATYDTVIIGNSATASTYVGGAKLNINTTDSIMLPSGTTAQRPGAVGFTDTVGMLRYSTTNGTIEWYNGTQWQTASTQFTVIADQQFTGTGSQTAFTLSAAQTTASCIVSINGVVQIPTLAYSVTSTTLTFTEAPANGEVIDVRQLTTTQNVTSLASVNGIMQISADNSGVYINTGTSSTTVTTYWNTAGAQVNSIGNTAVASANVATTIDTLATGTYRSAKYVVQATNGANYQVMEALLISDGTTATVMSYGTVQTGANVGVLTATQSGSNALLQFVSLGTNTNVRVKKDYNLI